MAELIKDLTGKFTGSAKSGIDAAKLKAEELRATQAGHSNEQSAPAFGSTGADSLTNDTTTSSGAGSSSLKDRALGIKSLVTDKLQRGKEETTGESAQGETASESATIAANEQVQDKANKAAEYKALAREKAGYAAGRTKEELLPVRDTAVDKLRPEREQLKSDLTEEQQRAQAAAQVRLAAATETARIKAEAVQRSLAETGSTTQGRTVEVAGGFASEAGSVARTAAEAAKAVLGGAHKTLVQASRTNDDMPADNGLHDGSAGRELHYTKQATVDAYGTTREQADAALRITQSRGGELIDVGRDGVVEVSGKADKAIDLTREEAQAKIDAERGNVHNEASRLTEKTRGIAHRQTDVAADTTTAVTAVAHEQAIKNAEKAKQRNISGDVTSTIEQGKAKATDTLEQTKQKGTEAAEQAMSSGSGSGTGGYSSSSTTTTTGTRLPDVLPTARASHDTGLETMQGQDMHYKTLPPPTADELAYERANPSLFGAHGGSSQTVNTSSRSTTGTSSSTGTSADTTTTGGKAGGLLSKITGAFGGGSAGSSSSSSGVDTSRDASSFPSSGQAFNVAGTEESFPGTSGGSSSSTGRGLSGTDSSRPVELPPLERQSSGLLSNLSEDSRSNTRGIDSDSTRASFGSNNTTDTARFAGVGGDTSGTSSGKTQDEVVAEQTAAKAKQGATSAAAALKTAAQAGMQEYKQTDGASADTTSRGAEALTHGTAAAKAMNFSGGEAETQSHIAEAGKALGAAAAGAVADYKGEGHSEGGSAALKARAHEATELARKQAEKQREEAERNMTPEQRESAKRAREIAQQKRQEAEETARAAKARAEELQREAKEAADLAAREAKHGTTGVKKVLVGAHKAKTDEKATAKILDGAEAGIEPMRAATEKLSSVVIAVKESLDTAMGKTKDAVVGGANTADDARHGRGEAGMMAQTAKDTALQAGSKAQELQGKYSGAHANTMNAAGTGFSAARGGIDKAKGGVDEVDSAKYGDQAEDKKNLAVDKAAQGAHVARSKIEEFTPQGQAKAHSAIDRTAETAEPRAHSAIDAATDQLHRGVDLAAQQAHTGTGLAQQQTNAAADAAKAAIDAQSDAVRRAAAEKEAAVKKQADLAAKTAAVFFGAKKV